MVFVPASEASVCTREPRTGAVEGRDMAVAEATPPLLVVVRRDCGCGCAWGGGVGCDGCVSCGVEGVEGLSWEGLRREGVPGRRTRIRN